MIRKITAFLLCIAVTLASASCGFSGPADPSADESVTPDGNNSAETPSGQSETEEGKKILKLINYAETEVASGISFASEPAVTTADFDYGELDESEVQKYGNQPELQVFAEWIKNQLGTELNGSWEYFVHYYTQDMSSGMIQFQYCIGEIRTEKNILFSLENGRADMVYYNFPDSDVDEEDLLRRVDLFKEKYTQEKYQLKDGEKLVSEDTNYSYYYGADALVYSYAVFFSYGEYEVINNDYGSEYIIDSDGNTQLI